MWEGCRVSRSEFHIPSLRMSEMRQASAKIKLGGRELLEARGEIGSI